MTDISINEDIVRRLEQLHGELNHNELSRIINNHLRVAVDEIEEDVLKDNCSIDTTLAYV